MQRIVRAVVVLSALLILPLAAKNAFAGPVTEDFHITWSGALGNGSANAIGIEQSTGVWLITSLTGTQAGMSLTLLAPNAYGYNDNIVDYPANPALVTGFGLASMNSTESFDIYYNPSAPGITYWECDSNSTNCASYGNGSQLTSFNITPGSLPEPTSIIGLSSGLLAFVGVIRRKSSQ
jgi:hypothetical protein